MSSALDVALVGMTAALDQLNRTAEQIARPTDDDDLAEDIVELNSAQHSFEASASVARAADETLGSLLDLFA